MDVARAVNEVRVLCSNIIDPWACTQETLLSHHCRCYYLITLKLSCGYFKVRLYCTKTHYYENKQCLLQICLSLGAAAIKLTDDMSSWSSFSLFKTRTIPENHPSVMEAAFTSPSIWSWYWNKLCVDFIWLWENTKFVLLKIWAKWSGAIWFCN